MKTTRSMLTAMMMAGIGLAAGAVQAAGLTEGVFHIIGSSNAPASDMEFKVSVYPGKEGFAGVGNVGSTAVPVDETFNNPVADYRFFTDGGNDTTATTYASGAGGLISDLNPLLFKSGYFGSPDFGNVWTTTDPGTGYSTTPDFNNNTMVGNVTSAEGSIDISKLTEGSIYFFYGAYRSASQFDFTMSDTDGPGADIVLNDVGDNDFANNNEMYAYSIDFVNDAGYDQISYVHTNPRVTGNGGSGRYMGLVVTAPEAESGPGPGEPTWKIDVNSGTSPTMSGWTGLDTAAGSGNGSDVTVDGVRFEAQSADGHRDRGGPNDLARDFIFDDGGPVGIRLWDLPDGLYEARVWTFDQGAQPGTQNVGLGWTGVGPNIIVGQTGPSLDPFVFQFDSRLYADGVGIFIEPASSNDGGNGRARLNALQLTLIPEPATMGLLALAACGLGGYVRKRRST